MSKLEVTNREAETIHATWIVDKVMFADNSTIESETKTLEGKLDLKWYLKSSLVALYGARSPDHFEFNIIIDSNISVDYTIYYRIHNKERKLRSNSGTINKENNTIILDRIHKDCFNSTENAYFSNGKFKLSFEGILKYKKKPTFLDESSNWGLRLKENDSTDFELVVSGQTYKVHKLLLSVESSVFNDLFKNATGDQLDIPGYKEETVKAAIDFCYAQDIFEFVENTENALELLFFADKHDFKTLKSKLEAHLRKSLTKENIGTMVAASSKIICQSFRQACIDFVRSLLNNNKNGPAIDVSTFDTKFLQELVQQSLNQ